MDKPKILFEACPPEVGLSVFHKMLKKRLFIAEGMDKRVCQWRPTWKNREKRQHPCCAGFLM
jgi:hypothetical protein